MKKYLFFLIVLALFSIAFSWNSYGNGNNNLFTSSLSGAGLLSEKFTVNTDSTPICAPLIYNNTIFIALNTGIEAYSNSNLLWGYATTNVTCPVMYNDNLIFGDINGITSLNLNNSINWQVNNSIVSSIIINNNLLFASYFNESKTYNADNGSLIWSTTLPYCNTQPAILNNNVIIGCGENIYSINMLNSSLIFNTSLNSEIVNAPLIKDGFIFLSYNNEMIVLSESGEVLNQLYYFSLSSSVETNIAANEVIYSCALNGLYTSTYEQGIFYYTNYFSDYSGCISPVLFDFNDDNIYELLISYDDKLLILDNEGVVLNNLQLDSNAFISIGNIDNDNIAEIILLSDDGILYVYDTGVPDLSVELSISSEGIFANISNLGNEEGNANYSFYSPYEYISGLVNVPSQSSVEIPINWTPSNTGEYPINISVFDESELNLNNNIDEITITAINVSDYLSIIFNNKYYDFISNYTSTLLVEDINNDNADETLIEINNGEFNYLVNYSLKNIGDLYFNIEPLSSSYYDNETIIVNGEIFNTAEYSMNNFTISLLINDDVVDSITTSLSEYMNDSFSFTIDNLIQSSTIKIIIDSNDSIYENNENNNVYSKSIVIVPSKVHDLTLFIDAQEFSLHNQIVDLFINNTGDFDEVLTVLVNNELIETITTENNFNAEYELVLDYIVGFHNINVTIFNNYSYYSISFSADLICVYNNDCSINESCMNGVCTPIICECGYIGEHSCVSYECCDDFECASAVCTNNVCVESSPITGAVTVLNEGSNNNNNWLNSIVNEDSEFLYWVGVIFLLSLSSIGVYVVTFKFFENQCHILAITNFLIFAFIAYLFKPENMMTILFEEVLILSFVFSIQKVRN